MTGTLVARVRARASATMPTMEEAIPPGYTAEMARRVDRERCRRMMAAGVADPGMMSPQEWSAHRRCMALAARQTEEDEKQRWLLEENADRLDIAQESLSAEETAPPPPRTEDALPVRPRVREIQKAVAAAFSIDMIEMHSRRRTNDIVLPRQIAMYLARRLTVRSFPEIGRCFGGRDHTTTLHAFRKIAALREANPLVAERIAAIEALFVEAVLDDMPGGDA